jgi:PAS domain S-box-containing protein
MRIRAELKQERRARRRIENQLATMSSALSGALEKVTEEVERRRTSESQLTEAIDHMSEGFVIYGTDERLSLCNSRNLELYWETADLFEPGIHIEDMLRAGASRGQYGDDIDDMEAWIAERLERFRNPDGVHVEKLSNGKWIQISERKTRDGRTIGVRTDITELMRREQALGASEEKFRSVMNVARDAIIAADRNGRIIVWNQGAMRIFGYSLKTVLTVTVYDLVADGWRHTFEQLLESSLLQDGAMRSDNTTEIVCRHQDGSEFPAEITIANWRSNGSFNFSVIVRDITQRKTAEAERHELERKMRRMHKMQALGTLAGGTAHEFNNLLVPIIGLTEMVIDNLSADDEDRHHLETVLVAAEQARDLVARILSFSREQPTTQQAVDFKAALIQSLPLLRKTLPATITLRERITAADVTVCGDIGELQQIVLNLASNAAYAIGEAIGSIFIDLETVDLGTKPPAGHHDLAPGRYARLRVSDSGCGMDPGTTERIFEPFFTTKPVGLGTGLGLSMTHSIVARAKGSIAVSSACGMDTTFELMIPIAEAASASRKSAPPPADPRVQQSA